MIYIREITKDDIDIINEYRNDKESVDLLGGAFRYINIETDNAWFDSYQKNRNNNIRCVICLEQTNEVIGMVYLLNINWIFRSADFAICIGSKHHRGKGIGKLASVKMLENAFYDMNLNRIQLKVLENNEAAKKLYKSIGFVEEGLLRNSVFKNNEYNNQIIMSLLRDEFSY